MARQRTATDSLPPCYAMVLPGLEPIAEKEIVHDLGGEIKRTGSGIVVFRVPEVETSLLKLRTVEDVFLLAWGTDQLSYRAEDLDRIRRWTNRDVDWAKLLRLHHSVHPKPKGKPTYHIVTQMTGVHGYRRIDARQSLLQGLAGKLPDSWRLVDENAAVEVWLTINGASAVCGLRLSDRSMRHRTYKEEHMPASLRPTLAAAMVRLAEIRSEHVVLDPMCGAGTILAEVLEAVRGPEAANLRVLGGDLEGSALRAAASNLRQQSRVKLSRWDARRLPLPDLSVDRLVSNPPFGKQLSRPEEIAPLYKSMLRSYDRVLRPGGRCVFLVGDMPALREAAQNVGWGMLQQYRVRVLGKPASLSVWRKT